MGSWKKYDIQKERIVSFYCDDGEDTRKRRLERLETLSEMCGTFTASCFGSILEPFAMRLLREGKASDRWSDTDFRNDFGGYLDPYAFDHTRSFKSSAGAGFITAFPYTYEKTIINAVMRLRELYPDLSLICGYIHDYNFLWDDGYTTPIMLCSDNEIVRNLPVYEYLMNHSVVP